MCALRSCLLALCVLCGSNSVQGLDIAYCAPLNTADEPGNTTQFQSNGFCYQQCVDNFAYAVNQNHGCWCSMYTPGDTNDVSDCNLPCPGYTQDNCGGRGLFAYQALLIEPLGTRGRSSSSSSSSLAPPSTSSSSSSSSSSESEPEPEPEPKSSTTESSTTWTPTPVTSLETITGQVRTVTVTPTAPPDSQSMIAVSKSDGGGGSGGLGTGGAVGLAIGLISATSMVCVAVYFCLKRRKKNNAQLIASGDQDSDRAGSAGPGGPVPSRTMSEHSRFVLGTDGRNVVESWEPDGASITPAARRNSRLMPIDQRLDPYQALYMHQGKSGESVNTIQDNRDYSRRVQPNRPILRMTNPDTDTSTIE